MNKHEELIAAHYSEKDVSEELLKQIKEDESFLDDLIEFEEVERLLQLDHSDLFVKEVSERLTISVSEGFVKDVIQEIEVKKTVSFRWLVLAACLLFIPILMLPRQEADFAVNITNSTGAKWGEDSVIQKDTVSFGSLQLTDGYVELRISNGVELLLEAPVSVNLESTSEVIVKEGKLVAKVPSSVLDFSVITSEVKVSEKDVEYGVSASKGSSEIHAIHGSVTVASSRDSKTFNLEQDEAGQFDAFQQMAKIVSNPSRFMRSLPGKSAESPQYLHWSFDERTELVNCLGPGIMGKKYPGKLAAFKGGEGPKFIKGLYGSGIYFNGQDAYIETDFKGIGGNRPRTVSFWVKVPKSFDVKNGYGIVSWGVLEEGAAWQVSPNPNKRDGLIGRLRVGTHKGMVIGTTDLRDDEWHHVAIVMYGGESAEVSTHILMYVDGQLERTSKKSVAKIRTDLTNKKSKALMIGQNLGFQDTDRASNKFFKGWLDELFIFDAALSGEQIRSLMNTNKLPQSGDL